jgi:fatty acid desaturase
MLKASDLVTHEQMLRLRGKSNLAGAALVLHAWALILGSIALFAWQPNPATFLFAWLIVGGRQLGLAILMHDAAHGLLFASRRLNDWVGQWLCAYPVLTDLELYRPYHLKHHRFTQQADDPDLILSAPFPITRRSLARKLIRDLTGQTAFARRKLQLRNAWGPAGLTARQRAARLIANLGGGLLTNAVLCGAAVVSGYWWLYPALWLVPLGSWYQLISRIRNIAEHAVVPDNDDPLRNTRTTLLGPLTRLLVAPYWVNYHLEHHLFLFVPCWRLTQAHRALIANGYGPKMELQRGYRAVLRSAASATVDRRGGGGDSMQFI